MDLSNLEGVIPALATPLTKDEEVDEKALRKIVKRVVNNGVNGVLAMGSSGEGVMLKDKEKARAVEIVVNEVSGKVPVIAGTGDISTKKIKDNNKMVADLGADYALVVPPFYFKIRQNDVENFYRDIASENSIPIMIYNIPSNTKIKINIQVIKKLSELDNIVGIKDSSGDWVYFQKLLYYCQSKNFKVFAGRAKDLFAAYTSGAAGSITPVPNVDPNTEVDLYEYIKANNYKEALELQKRELELASIFGYGVLPVGVKLKAALEIMNICEANTIKPLPTVNDESIYNDIKVTLKQLNII